MVWAQARESVHFRDNSKQVTALVVETREVPFTVTGSNKEQYRYEMTVTFEVDGHEQSADGYIEKWQYVEHAFTPGGEVTCYYDINDPSKVIFCTIIPPIDMSRFYYYIIIIQKKQYRYKSLIKTIITIFHKKKKSTHFVYP